MRSAPCIALALFASAAAAQQPDHAMGPWFDVHYTSAAGTTISGAIPFQPYSFTTGKSSGGGLTIGYGFLPWLSGFVTVDGAGSQTVSDATPVMNGSLSLSQVDAGVRAQVAIPKAKLTPYAILAYSSRLLSGSTTGLPQGSGTFSTWGSAVTYGAGVEFFFAPAFTLDASWQQSSGAYSHVEMPNNTTFSTGSPSSSASRVLAGVTWHAGPVGAAGGRPVTASDPLEIGQEVRVSAGSKTVSGKLEYVGRDTLVVQQQVKGEAVQTAVPVQCISGVQRQRLPRPIEGDLINGAVIGAVGGGLAAAVVNGQSSSKAKSNGTVAVDYLLTGAVLGGGIGAIVNAMSNRWEPVAPPAKAAMAAADRQSLCSAFPPG